MLGWAGFKTKDMDEQYILSKIEQLMPDEHQVPRGVVYTRLKNAIQEDVTRILTDLFKAGRVTYRNTLNGIMVNIKDNTEYEANQIQEA